MSDVVTRARAAAKAVAGIFSEGSAKQAYGLLSGIFPGAQGMPPVRGTREYLRAYSQMPWLRAVASRVATKVATTEWQLFVQRKKGKGERAVLNKAVQRAHGKTRAMMLKELALTGDLDQITDHPLLDVLHKPNPMQTGEVMAKTSQLHLDLVGETFWLIERAEGGPLNGMPIALWPIPPDWVINTPTPVNRFFRVSFRAWRGLIPDTEIIWFADPDPSNPYGRGSGTAQSLTDELETDEFAAKHTKAFFYNRARPDLIVYPKQQNMRESDVERLEEDWLSRTQGFFRAFKPYFLTREVGIHELEQNFRSLQLTQLREFERDIVIQTFGMPPELLGILQNANRATITAADLIMARYVVEPRLEFKRGVMQERLVPQYDERIILHYVSPVQDDKDFQLDVLKAAPFTANVDEWRALQGQPPMKNAKLGAMIAVPGTVSLKSEDDILNPPPPPGFDENGMPLVPPAAPGDKPKPGEGDKPAAGDKPKPKPDSPTAPAANDKPKPKPAKDAAWKAMLVEASLAFVDAGDVRDAELTAKAADEVGDGPDDDVPEATRLVAQLEPALARALVRGWTAVANKVDAAALREACARNDHGAMMALCLPDEEDASTTEALAPRLAAAFMGGVAVGATPLRAMGVEVGKQSVSMDAINPEAAAWARAHAAALVAAGEATRERIRALIVIAATEGIDVVTVARTLQNMIGLTAQQMRSVANFEAKLAADGVAGDTAAARVARYVAAQRRQRALTIARTELNAAVSAGQEALWRRAVADNLIDANLMMRTWLVTWDETLEYRCEELADKVVGLFEPFAPGLMHPPAHPRCRCAVGLVRRPKAAPLP